MQVDAGGWTKQAGTTGRVRLYGIEFDTDEVRRKTRPVDLVRIY